METEQATPAPDAVTTESSPVTETTETVAADAGKSEAEEKSNTQKRIDKLTWEKGELARQNAHLMTLAYGKEPEVKVEKKEPKQAPTLAQFEYDEARFNAASVEYWRAEAASAALEALNTERQKERQQERVKSFTERENAFAKENPDYFTLTRDPSLTFFDGHILEAIAESEDGVAVAMHLAKNPSLGFSLQAMKPAQALIELGRIEARLEKSKVKEAQKPVSTAPPPPPKVEAAEPEKVTEKDPSKMSDPEFAKWRKRQIAQRG